MDNFFLSHRWAKFFFFKNYHIPPLDIGGRVWIFFSPPSVAIFFSFSFSFLFFFFFTPEWVIFFFKKLQCPQDIKWCDPKWYVKNLEVKSTSGGFFSCSKTQYCYLSAEICLENLHLKVVVIEFPIPLNCYSVRREGYVYRSKIKYFRLEKSYHILMIINNSVPKQTSI